MQGTAYHSQKLKKSKKPAHRGSAAGAVLVGVAPSSEVIRIDPRTPDERIVVTGTTPRVTLNKLGGNPCTVCFDKWVVKMPISRGAVRFNKGDAGRYHLAYAAPGVDIRLNRRRK